MPQQAVMNFAAAPGSVELQEFDRPTIGDDDVLLDVQAVSVCGSDLHQWQGSASWHVNYPVVLGHEFCGTIAQVGSRVKDWHKGQRVVSETAAVIDENSPLSRRGLYNLDPARLGFGYGTHGAMTRYTRVPARCLHALPDNVPFEIAALTEPCCVAYNATINNADIKPGDRVVVMGPGPIGLLCAIMAKMHGGDVAVVGLERDHNRLAVAESYGCTPVIGDATDWANEVDGLGCDVVIDAAGVSASLKHAMQIVRPAGTIAKVGWGPKPLDASLDQIVQKNVRLQGSFSHNWPVWERIIRLMSTGQLDVAPLIGGQWPLEGWREAFDKMNSGEIVKAVLRPQQ